MCAKGEAEGGTVEVAHEALFRTWKRLESWLEPERGRLEALRACQVDAGNWERAVKDEGFLNHRSKRLAEAVSLSADPRYATRLESRDFAFLAACQAAERAARVRARRGNILAGALALLLIASGAGLLGRDWLVEQYQWRLIMGGKPLTAAEEKYYAAHPGETFKECAINCPAMVVIRDGNFIMGSPDNEKDHEMDESPLHEVKLAGRFAAGKYAVTFDEWGACVSGGGCVGYSPDDGDWGRGNRPVINVGWDDAQEYVKWLSHVTGKNYRLLTEAEWEYAARAGTRTAFWWGDEIGENNAHCAGCGSKLDRTRTAPSGQFQPNAFGLYEMVGKCFPMG